MAKDVQSLDCNSLSSNNLLDIEEFKLASCTITPGIVFSVLVWLFWCVVAEEEKATLQALESSKPFEQHVFASYVMYNAFTKCANIAEYPYLNSVVTRVSSSEVFTKANAKSAELNTSMKAVAVAVVASSAAAPAGKKDKAAKKAEKAEKGAAAAASAAASAAPANYDDIVKPVLGDVDWASTGLVQRCFFFFFWLF